MTEATAIWVPERSNATAFTTDVPEAVRASEIVFIAVGTPPDEDGSADLSHVLAVAATIGTHIDGYKVVVNKSTVPVGTVELVAGRIASAQATRGTAFDFDVCSNPEFLKEDPQRPVEKDMLLFWKMLSFVLFGLLIISLLVSASR